MKYEENVWYGWNGGECPVHPETMVEVQYNRRETHTAKKFVWSHSSSNADIVAFRVIKEHREPREFWLTKQTLFDLDGNISGYAYHQSSEKDGDFKVREVIE